MHGVFNNKQKGFYTRNVWKLDNGSGTKFWFHEEECMARKFRDEKQAEEWIKENATKPTT